MWCKRRQEPSRWQGRSHGRVIMVVVAATVVVVVVVVVAVAAVAVAAAVTVARFNAVHARTSPRPP